jgi:GNAT superfamily N-acetyltransferase
MSTVALAPHPPARVVLRDGRTVILRPIRASDGPALRAFLEGVSVQSLRRRFFGTPDLDRTTNALIDGCRAGDFGLIAEDVSTGAIVAHAAWFLIEPDRAESAFLVTDHWQGRGLGSVLLAQLVKAAGERGVTTLVAETLPFNHEMIAVFERSGYPVHVRRDDGSIEIALDTTAPPLLAAA